ncbi:MAG TPA: hypothetical protein VEY09_10295 [Pyrinomonadaceae bacterium]|nr:hypothetical protein [Pyrinomonadaceae bacterium]
MRLKMPAPPAPPKTKPKALSLRVALAAALLAALAAPAAAQEPWAGKPFREWTKREAERVLNDSPWAQTRTVKVRGERRVQSVAGSSLPGATGTEDPRVTASVGGAEAPVDFNFTLRLRSGLPVRQALVRLRQLEAGYDKMKESERAAFDASARGLLDCPACSDYYVLTLSARSRQAPGADPVFSTLKGARLEDLRRYVYLANDRGGRRPLVNVVPPRVPGDEAVFYFARLDEAGAPLFTAANRKLIFNLSDGEVNTVTNLFEVDLTGLTAGDRVEF